MSRDKKIAVLMSGGIDSSFSAFYLKKQGFDVVGVTFLHYSKEFQKDDIERAKKIAKEIGISHFVFDIRKEFRERIIKKFLDDYRKGITPNPCPFCNKEIKFGFLLKETKKLDTDFIATGHYAKKIEIKNQAQKTKKYFLLRARDKNKDQSYFLWQLTQKELKKLIFPLGNFLKNEVLEEIKNLPFKRFFKKDLKEYKESQDICFVKNTGLEQFLEEKIGKRPGPIFDKNGNQIGEHQGIHFFTIGQRAGLKIKAKKPNQEPFYVVKIDAKNNSLIVGKEEDLYKSHLTAENVNWILEEPPKVFPFRFSAKIRYRHPSQRAIIYFYDKKKKICKVRFIIPQRAITPGQHIVFYKKDLVLGGGIIVGSKL